MSLKVCFYKHGLNSKFSPCYANQIKYRVRKEKTMFNIYNIINDTLKLHET